MILESVFGLFLMISGGKAEVDPTTTVLKMIYKGNEFKKEQREKKDDNK